MRYSDVGDFIIVKAIEFGDTGIALFFTWLVLRASSGFGGLFGAFLTSTIMVFIGRISYGIYVLHLFVLYIFREAFADILVIQGLSQLERALFMSVITVIFATVSWFLLERPINRFRSLIPYA